MTLGILFSLEYRNIYSSNIPDICKIDNSPNGKYQRKILHDFKILEYGILRSSTNIWYRV